MARILHLAIFLVAAQCVAATVLPCKGSPPKCKDPNEEYITAKTGEPTCDDPSPKQCYPVTECRCKSGYVRFDGKCIKSCDCPAKCRDPNEVFVLAKYGEPTCDEPSPKPCAPVSECRCRDGYVRNKGICIKPCDCPVQCNDPNEEFVTARTDEATCDNLNPLPCATVKECRCKSGYVRYKGVCIKASACPVKCKYPNEEYVLAKFSEPSCDSSTPKPISPIEECRCRSGYVRYNGFCILPIDCPAKCKEMFEDYVTASMSEPTCAKPNAVPIATVKECRCIQGYVRDNGKCILPISCPCSDPNEMYITSIFSEPTCSDRIPKSIEPVSKCQCKGGYLRENGRCIPPEDCPVICQDPNEEYITAIFSEMSCTDQVQRSISPTKECRCKPGYLRDAGKCVLPSTCPVICPDPMEEYILVSTSESTCANPNTIPIPQKKECRCRDGFIKYNGKCIIPSLCPCTNLNEEFMTTTLSEGTCLDPLPKAGPQVTACRCRPGYVRDQGMCIAPSDCPPICTDNEEYVLALFSEPSCNDTVLRAINPIKECRCKFGYVRNDGKCILQSQCPVICKDPNEEYIVTQSSEPTCTNTLPSLIVTVQECRCKNGYVRNNGVCILPNACPVICPDPNEDYVTCLFSEPSCADQIPKAITPIQECRCKPGFLRDNGKCVLFSECPVICTDPNADYVLSQLSEPTCDNPIPVAIAPVKECRCKPGYVKLNGLCVLPTECPVKCPDPMLEEYVMTYLSEPTCLQKIPASLIVPVKECRCKTGYVRENGKCILPSTCPVICNDPFEEYVLSAFTEPTCQEQTKRLLNSPIQQCRCKDGYLRENGRCILSNDCPVVCSIQFEEYIVTSLSEPTCFEPIPKSLPSQVKECRCKNGYVRYNGQCILPTSCPQICTDPNEEYIMAIFGEKTCDNQTPAPCMATNECRCKDGFVRYNGKCIPPCECPSRCSSPDEEYVMSLYTERTCENPVPSPCAAIAECRCKDGLFRNNGVCIPPSSCPCGPNEVFSLTSPVEAESCSNIGQMRSPLVRPGCMCIDDYVRDCHDKCIPRCNCPTSNPYY